MLKAHPTRARGRGRGRGASLSTRGTSHPPLGPRGTYPPSTTTQNTPSQPLPHNGTSTSLPPLANILPPRPLQPPPQSQSFAHPHPLPFIQIPNEPIPSPSHTTHFPTSLPPVPPHQGQNGYLQPFPGPFLSGPLERAPYPHHLPFGMVQALTPVELGPYLESTQQKPSRASARPHPHISRPILFITSIPPDIEEQRIADAVHDCLPVRIRLDKEVVPQDHRLMPDAHYDWMPRRGTLEFTTMDHAEKALSCLLCHPLFIEKNIYISPFPPPLLLPLPDNNTAARLLQPVKLMTTVPAGGAVEFQHLCPSPGEVWEVLRDWGSLRSVFIWVESGMAPDGSDEPGRNWRAKVEFWYEDEARRFEHGFGQTGSLLKGWQIAVMKDPTHQPMSLDLPPLPMPPPMDQPFTPSPFPTDNMQFVPKPENIPVDQMHGYMGVSYVPDPLLHPGVPLPMGIVPPQTPPLTSFGPVPWANHAPMFNGPLSPPLDSSGSSKSQSLQDQQNSQPPHVLRSSASTASMRSSTSGRRRTWSANMVEVPGEGPKAVGIVADDGTNVSHGPGQHIQPAPRYGPGSSSISGLVDLSNVFVKGLDPDISSEYLADLFGRFGKVVSARVMRDDLFRSRGYGFVSFSTPAEAARAIHCMHGQTLGSQPLSVTNHEPRKVRPEKLAERNGYSGILSPVPEPKIVAERMQHGRFDRRGRPVNHDKGGPGTDDIRSLSPEGRKVALAKRVSTRVKAYAQTHSIPEDYVEPTINALVSHDLALIPLLHDASQLAAKIAETFNVLQEDPDLNINLGIRRPGAPTAAEQAEQDKGDRSPEEVERQSEEKLMYEVHRIDPVHVQEVVEIMKSSFGAGDLERCVKEKSVLVRRYNQAKKVLLKRQEEAGSEAMEEVRGANGGEEGNEGDVESASPPTARRRVEDGESEDGTLTSNDDPLTPIAEAAPKLEPPAEPTEITIKHLAEISATEAVAYLLNPDNHDDLAKLGLERPGETTVVAAVEWMKKLGKKPVAERKSELAARLGKMLELSQMTKSAKLKVARELVNAEPDDSAMCQLMLYPPIIRAKVEANRAAAKGSKPSTVA